MNQHTPLPWIPRRETDWLHAQVWTDDGRHLADVFGESYAAREANARVMAGAPEMLVKLRDAVTIQEGFPVPSPWVAQAKELLAKIDGHPL